MSTRTRLAWLKLLRTLKNVRCDGYLLRNEARLGAADRKMSRFSRVESLEETSFSNSIERSVGAADATLQHLASAKETFGDLEAAYRTFKHELEIVKTEHATQVRKSLHSVIDC